MRRVSVFGLVVPAKAGTQCRSCCGALARDDAHVSSRRRPGPNVVLAAARSASFTHSRNRYAARRPPASTRNSPSIPTLCVGPRAGWLATLPPSTVGLDLKRRVSAAAAIRGRSHPTRFARGTWLAAQAAASFYRRLDLKRRVSAAAAIRGRSHPTRFARGTWLAAQAATSFRSWPGRSPSRRPASRPASIARNHRSPLCPRSLFPGS